MEAVKEFSDEELIKAIVSDKSIDRPVKFIYRHHFSTLSHFILQNDGNEQDAEDIFQETVLSFIELVRLNKFRGESSVKTFLYAVNRNIWLNELKKRGRQKKRHSELLTSEQGDPENVEGFISKREARAEVMRTIDELGETCKKIIVLFYYENLSINEILKQLNYENEQVVRNKKGKCMKKLEEKLSSDPERALLFKKALQYE